MTVVHGYMDHAMFVVGSGNSGESGKTPTGLDSSPQLDTNAPSFRSLQMVAALCNKADFVEEDVQKNVAIADRRSTSDASETALIKFLEPIEPIRPYRAKFHEVYILPFNSHLKFQISIRQTEVRAMLWGVTSPCLRELRVDILPVYWCPNTHVSLRDATTTSCSSRARLSASCLAAPRSCARAR